MYKYLLVLLLSVNVSFASGVKLVEYFVMKDSKEAVKFFAKHGIMGDDLKELQSYAASALASLTKKNSNISKEDLRDALVLLPVKGEEAKVRRSLQILLDKEGNTVSDKEIVQALGSLIDLANSHGKSVVATCLTCKKSKLVELGLNYGLKGMSENSNAGLIKRTTLSDPEQLNSYIRGAAATLKVGDYSKVTTDIVAKQEEKTFAMFLALGENGNADQKAFFKAVADLSTKNGKTNMFDPKNPNKLWRMASADLDSKSTAEWVDILKATKARAEKDGVSAEEAFYRTLKDEAGDDAEKVAAYNSIKSKGCFFK